MTDFWGRKFSFFFLFVCICNVLSLYFFISSKIQDLPTHFSALVKCTVMVAANARWYYSPVYWGFNMQPFLGFDVENRSKSFVSAIFFHSTDYRKVPISYGIERFIGVYCDFLRMYDLLAFRRNSSRSVFHGLLKEKIQTSVQ